MKKITLVTLAFIGLVFSAKAQIQKGNVLIGADLTNLDLRLSSPTRFIGTINPKAAWFIQDNIALGAYGKFGINTVKGTGATIDYGVGALGRVYSGAATEVIKHGRFFGEANIGIEGQNLPANGGSTNGLGLGVGPGFAYFITPSIGLETLLKYNGIVGFGSSPFTNSVNLNFGFQIYLPGRATARKVINDVK